MAQYQIRHAGVTDTGNVRAINQDWLVAEGDLAVVADGMGGPGGGEIAARLAVETLREAFAADPTATGLVEAVRRANAAVWAHAEAHPDLAGMGTTIAAVARVTDGGDDRLAVVNVGDSRAYLLQDGRLSRLTADHSLVADLVRAGALSEDEARTHPERHVLTLAVGVSPEVEPHTVEAVPMPGDRLLLCSDGLFNELTDEEITEILVSVPDPAGAATRLVARAKEEGGRDNITAVVLDVVRR
ncbi:MAG TPA: protein phosphatase 2C domain-containing protein [Acidimicrobiales bacterium]